MPSPTPPPAPPTTPTTPTPPVGTPPSARPATWEDIVTFEARKQRVNPKLALAVMQRESAGRPDARSPKGAIGLMQLMPDTAAELGVDPADPIQNIRGGVTYLKQQIDRHQGDVVKALSSYNAGPNGNWQNPETQAYVQNILGRLTGQAGSGGSEGSPTPSRTPAFRADPAAEARKIGAPPPAALPTLERTPAADPTQFEGPSTRLQEAGAAGKALLSGFNPVTPEGRRNLAGTAGAVVAGSLAAPTGPGAIAAGAAGAGAFAAAETAIENQLRGNFEANPTIEGATQAVMDLGGRAVLWPARMIGRRYLAHPVAQNVAKTLTSARTNATAALDRAMDAAREQAAGVRLATTRTLRGTRQAGIAAVAGAKQTAATLPEAAAAPARAAIGQAPPRTAVGRQVQAVVEGPAKSVLDQYGRAVAEAAESGPPLPLTAAREKAQAIFDEQIKGLSTYFSGTPQQTMDPILAGYLKNAFGNVAEADRAAFVAKLTGAGVEPTLAEATFETAKHPAMGVLRRVANAPGEVPFAAAHQLKTELDAAVNWESPARGLVKQSTKAIRQALREDLGSYAPYNEATARYAQTVNLFSKGHVATLRKQAQVEPGAFISRISPKAPEQVRMLREVLVGLPGQAGDRTGQQAGQRAWDGVRAAWTDEKILSKGGIDTLAERLDALPPDFVQEFYGDASGQAVLSNMRALATAYQTGVQQGKILVEGAKSKAGAALEAARVAGETARATEAKALRTLRTEKRLLKSATPEEEAFEGSTIFQDKAARSLEGTFADVLRALALGPGSFWGAYSIGRLFHGPKSAELLRWAAYSPPRTQQMVELMTSSQPARVAAGIARALQADQPVKAGVEAAVGAPPPRQVESPDHTTLAVTLRSDGTSAIGTPPPR